MYFSHAQKHVYNVEKNKTNEVIAPAIRTNYYVNSNANCSKNQSKHRVSINKLKWKIQTKIINLIY